MTARFPRVTLAVVAGAFLIASAPALHAVLIYDRDKILAGELWRMFSGHWVHLSTRHLVLDVSAMAFIGYLIESKNNTRFGILCMVGPFLISAASLFAAPNMTRYYGLSSLAMAAWTFLASRNLILRQSPLLSAVILVAAAAKIFFELSSATGFFVPSYNPQIRVAVTNHIAGAIIGALFAILPTCVSNQRRAKQVCSESPDYSRQV
jgi:rhomboid family GlyGly-CTERM serine protease